MASDYPSPHIVPPRSLPRKQTFILLHGRGSSGDKFGPPLLDTPISSSSSSSAASAETTASPPPAESPSTSLAAPVPAGRQRPAPVRPRPGAAPPSTAGPTRTSGSTTGSWTRRPRTARSSRYRACARRRRTCTSSCGRRSTSSREALPV